LELHIHEQTTSLEINMQSINLLGEGYLRLTQIIGTPANPGLFPISRSGWYEGIRQNRYPKPVKISPRCSAWRISDIRDLINKLGLEGK